MASKDIGYTLETARLAKDFLEECIFHAAMRVIASCENCSSFRPCRDELHAMAKEELAAWSKRQVDKWPRQKFTPLPEPRYESLLYGWRTIAPPPKFVFFTGE